MPRKPVILQSEFPYSVGGRCINKEWFNLPMETVWEIMTNHLYFIHHAFNARIHNFVLMSNHFHLLLSTPDANLSQMMEYFMGRTSRDLTEAGNRINQTYGGRHFKTMIRRHHDFLNAYKYIYRNPVKAKICNRVEEYKFSTLNRLLGFHQLAFPVIEDVKLFADVEGTLKWLNRPSSESDWESVKQALRKSEFKLHKDKNTHKENHLEFDLL